MPISGTLINCALIAAGTLLGLAVKKILPDRVRDTLMQAVGLVVLFIGIGGAVSACLTYADGAFGTKDLEGADFRACENYGPLYK